jgi:ATPase subunit of ABC transporter with duplicated ATPase domains
MTPLRLLPQPHQAHLLYLFSRNVLFTTHAQALRAHLGSFGVSGDLALQPMYTLSGGQKSRVAFAKLTFTKPHLLLLDEPSNHLDLDAVEALAQGLTMYRGGVLMVRTLTSCRRVFFPV